MKVAEYRHLIRLQSRTQVADGMGSTTGVWGDEYETWAGVWPVALQSRTKELTKDGKLTLEITHKVRIRYRSDVVAGWRVLFGSRTFDILSIINPDERNIILELVCREDV